MSDYLRTSRSSTSTPSGNLFHSIQVVIGRIILIAGMIYSLSAWGFFWFILAK